MYEEDIFKGKAVFVTGGAGTICRVQVEAMVLLGADAVIVGRNVDKTIKAAKEIEELRPGAKVLGVGNVDVRDVQSIAKAVQESVEKLGRIDFVIAGAAGNFLSISTTCLPMLSNRWFPSTYLVPSIPSRPVSTS